MIVISTGCPAGVGPEISVAVAAKLRRPHVLVGNLTVLRRAAELVGVEPDRLQLVGASRPARGAISVLEVGPSLTRADCNPRRPTAVAGQAQLAFIEAAYALVRRTSGAQLVTAPVSKSVIAACGLRRAAGFRGHTEWLEALDGAPSSVMCFTTPRFATSLVTTHLPLAKVSRALTPARIEAAIDALAALLLRLGQKQPRIAVCSLNPQAGESSLLGAEEASAIAPAIEAAAARLGRRVRIEGPIGAETAFRKAQAGQYAGVVAMYHDQATIPTKLVAFGSAVNVTWGLSIVRTSVDHGTGYDIAWKGLAKPDGLMSAVELAQRLGKR